MYPFASRFAAGVLPFFDKLRFTVIHLPRLTASHAEQVPGGLSVENEELPAGIVDKQRGNCGGNVGIGCVEPGKADEQIAGERTHHKRNQRNRIEQHQFMMPFMFTGFKDKQDIENVGGKVGEEKGDGFIKPVVSQPQGLGNDLNLLMTPKKQLGKRIALREGGKDLPGEEKKHSHVHHSGNSAAQAVFDELNEMVIFIR
ncbi:MAG: hypothetical protein PWQ29_1504 [Verrucomicrobiota bacterium]|jgi:hypothetical protein|nr:hypothetical protein [Verrucomicrobiota bacterium]MDK2964110.1 hypothetical protein [Verrucomicrobiota bacterium]